MPRRRACPEQPTAGRASNWDLGRAARIARVICGANKIARLAPPCGPSLQRRTPRPEFYKPSGKSFIRGNVFGSCRGSPILRAAGSLMPLPPRVPHPSPRFWRESGSSCSNYNLPGAPFFRVLCEIVEARDLDSKLPVPNGTGPKFPPLQTAQERGTRSRLIR